MTPNVFLFGRGDCREDFFSKSLAYILNRVPGVGTKVIRRIAVLAGRKPDHFGIFESCDFVAHERPDGHASSRPDLTIVCSKRTMYFENKLDSPLSLSQMQRHARLTRRYDCSLLFVSNILHHRPELRSLPGYLHPTDRDHYLWLDFLPAFDKGGYRGSRFAATMLSDFASALKTNGIVGRQLKGAGGNLYTSHSDAGHLALGQLSVLLKEVGFTVASKPEHEDTLRVYPVKSHQYPLLNPRFRGSVAWIDKAWDRECLEVTIVSKGSRRAIDRHLGKFPLTNDCAFVPDDFEAGYNYHGWFLLPVRFTGPPSKSEIDFRALESPFRKIFAFLVKDS